MKKILIIILAVSLLLFTGCGGSGRDSKTAGKHRIEIDVAGYGVICAELDGDSAPITVSNFLKLTKEGFYDGLTFHRVVPGFVVQGGDPEGTGMGGSDETIKGEFSENGVDNPLKHTRGALSMARSQDPNSASSQFFIVQEDAAGAQLDGKYAVFGYVTEGMEIVDKICSCLLYTSHIVPEVHRLHDHIHLMISVVSLA